MKIKFEKRNVYFRDQSLLDSFLFLALVEKNDIKTAENIFNVLAANTYMFKAPKSLKNIKIALRAFGLLGKNPTIVTKLGKHILKQGVIEYMQQIYDEMLPLKEMLDDADVWSGGNLKERIKVILENEEWKEIFLDFCPQRGYTDSPEKYLSSFINTFTTDFNITHNKKIKTRTFKEQIIFNQFELKNTHSKNKKNFSMNHILTAFSNITNINIVSDRRLFQRTKMFKEIFDVTAFGDIGDYRNRQMIKEEFFIDAYYQLFDDRHKVGTDDLEIKYVGKNNNRAYINSFIKKTWLKRSNFNNIGIELLKEYEQEFLMMIATFGNFSQKTSLKHKKTDKTSDDNTINLNPNKKKTERSGRGDKVTSTIISNKSYKHSEMLDLIEKYARDLGIEEFETEYKQMDFVYKEDKKFNIAEVKSYSEGFYKAIGQLLHYRDKVVQYSDENINLYLIGNFEISKIRKDTLDKLGIKFINILKEKEIMNLFNR